MSIYIYYSILFLFFLCFIIQLYYLLFVQRKLSIYRSEQSLSLVTEFPVSVIICARNESKNLQQYLPFVLNQKYHAFEVIVVNDCSYDNSEEVLREFKKNYPKLKVVTITEHPRHKTAKKFAATLGIKAAENEILLFTDADCKPDSDYWIAGVAANYQNENTEIVLAYSPYSKRRGVLNSLIRFETFQTALNYLSFSLMGMPYMGVGRNLSYKKSLFFRGKGFASHMHIPSGDDDLFVNQNATTVNTVIEIDSSTHTWSEPKATWLSHWKQKIRHLGAGKVYKAKHRMHLSFQYLSAVGFYLFFAICVSLKIQLIAVLSLFFLRFVCQLIVFYKPMEKLRNKDLLWWFILLDPFYYIYLTTLSIVGIFTKKVTWK